LGLAIISLALAGIAGRTASGDSTQAVPAAVASSPTNVTLNVDNGPLVQVLNSFSRQTGRNLVVGPEVTGNVTVRLSNMPWDEALNVILKPYGFG